MTESPSNVTLEEVTRYADLKPGDHLAVRKPLKDLGNVAYGVLFPIVGEEYQHHGVYMGDYQICHLQGPTKEEAMVQTIDLKQFDKGLEEKLYRLKYEKAHLPESTLELANKFLKNPEIWPKYSFAFNNCETFATYLKTGNAYSHQAFNAAMNAASIASNIVKKPVS